jgi:hypothetical protein
MSTQGTWRYGTELLSANVSLRSRRGALGPGFERHS